MYPDFLRRQVTETMERYDPQAIEAKWQKVWADEKSFHVPNPDPAELAGGERRKSYVVEMLPYPSGDLHMGHTLNDTIGDVITHTRAAKGMQVLRPMGYDAFGLPAENAAIKEGGHPRTVTERNIVSIREQMHRMGGQSTGPRDLDRRPGLLPLDAMAVPALLREGSRVPQGSAGQVVPERPDRARQRAGHRRALRAMWCRGRGEILTQWYSGSPITPTRCWTRWPTEDWPDVS